MKFIRDLYYAMATGAIIGILIGLHRRRARERREAEARAARVPPVNYHRQRRAWRPRRRIN
jgi:hypothetical protein